MEELRFERGISIKINECVKINKRAVEVLSLSPPESQTCQRDTVPNDVRFTHRVVSLISIQEMVNFMHVRQSPVVLTS